MTDTSTPGTGPTIVLQAADAGGAIAARAFADAAAASAALAASSGAASLTQAEASAESAEAAAASADSAQAQASAASLSASAAGSSENNAEAFALEAEHWAEMDKDVPVPEGNGTQFSAKHHADIALDRATAAGVSATEAEESAAVAEAAAANALGASQSAQAAADNAVAVVTGGTASLTASPGKIPIAGANGKIDPAYVDLLGGSSSTLHRSPEPVLSLFIYDTSTDSDGGKWTERCQSLSWYNEELCGGWLGAQESETAARSMEKAEAGAYFQLTTDGKFYRLEEGSGVTEVFRGNKRAFPRLAAIVADGWSITLYDLTEPGNPMWMRFMVSEGNVAAGATHAAIEDQRMAISSNSVVAGQGRLYTAGVTSGRRGLGLIDFARDGATYFSRPVARWLLGGIATRNKTHGYAFAVVNEGLAEMPSTTVYDIALVTHPDAPVDQVTGLQVPTLVAATLSGICVHTSSGALRQSASKVAYTKLALDSKILYALQEGSTSWYYALSPDLVGDSFSLTEVVPGSGPEFTLGAGPLECAGRSVLISASGSEVRLLRNDESDVTKGVSARITDTYTTGWMPPSTQRCYLANSATADRSAKAMTATVFGSVLEEPIAPGSELMSYTGFSPSNYIREAYSADLDFSGDWYISAWIKMPEERMSFVDYPFTPASLTVSPMLPEFWQKLGGPATAVASEDGLVFSAATAGVSTFRGPQALMPLVKITLDYTLSAGVGTLLGPGYAFFKEDGSAIVEYPLATNVTIPDTGGARSTTTFVMVSGGAIVLRIDGGSGTLLTIHDFLIEEAEPPSCIVSRQASSGAGLSLCAFNGHVGLRTPELWIPVNGLYAAEGWVKVEAWRSTGLTTVRVNGARGLATYANATTDLSNPEGVLTIGNSFTLDQPFQGDIALVRIASKPPTERQAKWMYEQERGLFEKGQCLLPGGDAVKSLAIDRQANTWSATQTATDTVWQGIAKIAEQPKVAGDLSLSAVAGNAKLLAYEGAEPGVSAILPSKNLKAELTKQSRLPGGFRVLEYVAGVSTTLVAGSALLFNTTWPRPPGATREGVEVSSEVIPAGTVAIDDGEAGTYANVVNVRMTFTATITAGHQVLLRSFNLPPGLTAKAVFVDGAMKREGTSADYTRKYNGFYETILFAVAPGYSARVQIYADREGAV